MICLRKILLLLTFVTVLPALTRAQDITGLKESEERISRDLDSLVNSWYVKMVMDASSFQFDNAAHIPEFPDSVYIDRLGKINSVITIPYNNIIRNHIHVYTARQAEKFRVILGLQDYYFPMIVYGRN